MSLVLVQLVAALPLRYSACAPVKAPVLLWRWWVLEVGLGRSAGTVKGAPFYRALTMGLDDELYLQKVEMERELEGRPAWWRLGRQPRYRPRPLPKYVPAPWMAEDIPLGTKPIQVDQSYGPRRSAVRPVKRPASQPMRAYSTRGLVLGLVFVAVLGLALAVGVYWLCLQTAR